MIMDKIIEVAADIVRNEPKVGVADTNVGCKWIPCSERLPEERMEVLIAREKNKHEICVGYIVKDVGWYDRCYNRIVFDVIAWQALPAPYSEEGGD